VLVRESTRVKLARECVQYECVQHECVQHNIHGQLDELGERGTLWIRALVDREKEPQRTGQKLGLSLKKGTVPVQDGAS
jgi:hypothetical protein